MNINDGKNSRQVALLGRFLDFRPNVKEDFNKMVNYYPSCDIIVKTKKYAQLTEERRYALNITIEDIINAMKIVK